MTSLRRFAFINGDEQLRLKLAGLGDTGNVTLWIGNKRFPVTVDNYDSTGTEYHWPSTGLSTDDPADLEWEEGDQVRVTLVYERARPSAPTYLTVKAPPGEDGTLEVRWEAPDTEGTFPTTHYLVEFLPVGDPRRVERSYVPVSTTSVTRTDLQTGVEYRVLVQALSGDGYGSEATRTITTNGVPASCAPNPGDLWCGVLTVGSRTNAYGYDRETGEDMGDLSDTDVDVGTNSYTISRISVDGVTGTTPGALTFVFHANTRPTAADLDTLVLQVGGRSNSFAFSDATVFGGRSASWFDAGLDWSEEEYVIRPSRNYQLRISVDRRPRPHIATSVNYSLCVRRVTCFRVAERPYLVALHIEGWYVAYCTIMEVRGGLVCLNSAAGLISGIALPCVRPPRTRQALCQRTGPASFPQGSNGAVRHCKTRSTARVQFWLPGPIRRLSGTPPRT